MLLLDTSVIVSFYIPQADSERAQRLLSSRSSFAISPLTEVEFASAIAKLVRIKSISLSDGRRVLDAFQDHVRQDYYVFGAITAQTFELARQWIASLQTPLRTLDALQLATAHLSGWTLVTADKMLIKSAGELGVAVQKL